MDADKDGRRLEPTSWESIRYVSLLDHEVQLQGWYVASLVYGQRRTVGVGESSPTFGHWLRIRQNMEFRGPGCTGLVYRGAFASSYIGRGTLA